MRKLLFFLCFIFSLPPVSRAGDFLVLDQRAECPLFRCPTGEWSNADSHVTLIREADAIVVEALCRKPENSSFSGMQSDGSPFAGDVFELLLSPRDGIYYHLAIAPGGAFYAAKKRDRSWGGQPGVTGESRVTGNEWRVRLRLPYAAMGEKAPEPGTLWKICIGQILPSEYGLHEASSLSGAKDYHHIEEYATLIFSDGIKERPRLTRIVPELSGCRFFFALPAGWQGECKAGWGGGSLLAREAHAEGESLSILLPYPDGEVPLKTMLPVTLQTGSEFRFAKVRIGDPGKVEIDRFYLMPGERELRVSHAIAEKVRLQICDEQGKIYWEKEPLSPQETILLPPDLRPGVYRLVLTGNWGRICREVVLLAGDFPLPPGKTVLHEGKLCRNGRPFFWVGISPTQKVFLPAPAFSLDLGKKGTKGNALSLLMLPAVSHSQHPRTMEYPALPEHLRKTAAWVEKADPHAEAMVRLAYEANEPLRENGIALAPADFMVRFYRGLKPLTGGRILSIHTDDRSQLAALSHACDVFEFAFFSSSYAPWMMENIRQDMQFLKDNAASGRPVLFWVGGSVPNKYCRFPEEVRCTLYLAMVHGFQGTVVHLGHGWMPAERSRFWSLLAHLDDEAQGIYALLADGKDVTGSFPLPWPLMGRATEKEKIVTLLIVNPTGVTQHCQYGEIAPYGIKAVRLPQ